MSEQPYRNEKRVLLLYSEDVNLNEISFLPKALSKVFKIMFFEINKYAFRLPLHTYDRNRKQYNSTLLLKYLPLFEPEGYDKYLGIVNVDLYTDSLNFVFGEAILSGKEAIISLCRLRPEFYGNPSDEKLFKIRIVKEAVHELGHVFGLTHCKNYKCVMHFSNSIRDTDLKSTYPCPLCQIRLFDRMGR
ncbi:MAG: archaemetzincin family Zn-dependent metalloprotease [Nitrososphaerota archaeon]|nr:archaemetzincin family Zn-dependent metalloprotease [Nitrososphaerota archaeon]